mgnify:FL=1
MKKFLYSDLKIIFAGICSTLIAIGLGRFIYTPILPNMQNALNLSSTMMGIISSYNYLGYLIGSIIPIIWKYSNHRNIIIFSSVISVITIFLMGITTDIKLFILLRFLCGVSSALGFIFTISFMFNFFKDSTNKTLQLYHFCGIGLGIVIGTIAVWIVSSLSFFWNHQWIFISFIGILLCIPLVLFIPKQLVVNNEIKTSNISKFKASFITISFGYFFFGIGYIIFGTFISAMARDQFYIPSYQYFFWVIVGFFAIPSVLFWDWISKKISIDYFLFFSCFTVTLGVSFLFFGNKLNFFFISCLLYGLGVPGSVALILVEGKKRFVGNINTSVAILTSAFSIGQILGPYLSGILIDTENEYKSSIILAFVCLVLSSFLMLDPKRLKTFKL